jgi:integrase
MIWFGLARRRIPNRQGHPAGSQPLTTSEHRSPVPAPKLRSSLSLTARAGAGVDTSVIALWLGDVSVETTQIYLHADLKLNEQALTRSRPPNGRTGRYQAPDSLLAWLEAL